MNLHDIMTLLTVTSYSLHSYSLIVIMCVVLYFLADTSRVYLSKVGNKSDYINACHIDVSLLLA